MIDEIESEALRARLQAREDLALIDIRNDAPHHSLDRVNVSHDQDVN